MKERIWLCRKFPRGKWTHGLARIKDGQIVVAECFHGDGFYPVGQRHLSDTKRAPERLFPGEKNMIIRSLFYACAEYLNKHDRPFLTKATRVILKKGKK